MRASWLDQLAAKTGEQWTAIAEARLTTDRLLAQLRGAVEEFDDPNYSIVVTGSLGRGEASTGSDVDWFLLVDGLSNPDHTPVRQQIAQRIKETGLGAPGPTGTFGDLVTSHELIHYIAGTRDSNENLTRRILLLSESRALTGERVRERVIGNVLARYVIHDPSVRRDASHTIPLFLLNDVVRYWRTVASDYASKMWERQHDEWAIRNIKLRFSRKLLFVWGLIAAFAGELFGTDVLAASNAQERLMRLSEMIREQTDVTPLDLLARVVLEVESDTVARQIFSSYDEFLRVLSDPDARDELKGLKFEDSESDKTYAHLREISREFRKGIDSLFFDLHPQLKRLIREYGVF